MSDTSITLSGPGAVTYLAEESARLVQARIEATQRRWRAYTATGIATLAFLGYAKLGDIQETVQRTAVAQVDTRVASAFKEYSRNEAKFLIDKEVKSNLLQVTQDLDAVRHDMRCELAFMQLTSLSSALANQKGFSIGERDAALALLRQAIGSKDVIQRPEFSRTLEQLLDTFAAADLKADIDGIDDALGEVAIDSPGIVTTMVIYYGSRLAGAAQLEDGDWRKFEKYRLAALHRHRMPELALPYQIGVEFRRNRNHRSDTVTKLIQDLEYLTPSAQAKAIKSIERNADEPPTNGEAIRRAHTFTRLQRAYRKDFRRIAANIGADKSDAD